MSDPKPVGPQQRPRRVKPLQPDLPIRGGVEFEEAAEDAPASVEKQKEQSNAALDNVRDGYRGRI
jgi:hypothetical protein